MIPLSTALSAPSRAGVPLPVVWQELMELGVEFRQGNLAVVAAGPGGNKSLFALNLALRAGVPALYVSADTDSFTTALRVASLLSGDTLATVEARIRDGHYKELLDRTEHIRWAFESSPTVEDIGADVEAFAHVFGEYPQLVIVDNLINVFSEEDDFSAMRHGIESLNILARQSGAAVLVLHHLTGEFDSGDVPPALGALMGKVSKIPALVLTFFRAHGGDLGVCLVKNRYGPSDPRGYLRAYLPIQPERARIG